MLLGSLRVSIGGRHQIFLGDQSIDRGFSLGECGVWVILVEGYFFLGRSPKRLYGYPSKTMYRFYTGPEPEAMAVSG
jgi:hypothetical protein